MFIELNRVAGTHAGANVGGVLTCGGTLLVANLSGTLNKCLIV